VLLHLAGVIRADLGRYPGIVSGMINGQKTSMINGQKSSSQ
jgi:hypothetical protein